MATSPPGSRKPAPDQAGDSVTIGGGQAHYLRLMNEQLMGWDDPRAMLERALAQDHFLLLCQKLLALKPGVPHPLCHEILLRLKQEETSMLPPGGFFPLAESLGMMPEIDRWVVRNVIAWSAAFRRANPGKPLPLMCVNLSGETFEDRAFLAFLHEQLDQSALPAHALCFELSETDVIEYRRRAREFAETIRPRCRITLDAFGSAKVSFAYLAGMTIDFIKIDGVVTQNILRDPAALARVKAINAACQKMGVRTIAESVESKEMLDKLREIGVDYVQGFGIAQPEPIGKIS